jgi:hypothetical protein
LWRATVRTLPLLIEQWGVIGLWAVARSPARQRFGDRWANTYVVRASVDGAWRAAAIAAVLILIAVCGYGLR